MAHSKKTHKKPAKTHRPKTNPKGIASVKEHEGVTTMQRIARLETSVRQLAADQKTDRETVKKALTAQTKFNSQVTKVLKGAIR